MTVLLPKTHTVEGPFANLNIEVQLKAPIYACELVTNNSNNVVLQKNV